MYLTIVNFGASFEDGLYIDGLLQVPWDVQETVNDFMATLDKDLAMKVYNEMPPDALRDSDQACRAYTNMSLRARVDSKVRGPHIFKSEEKLTEELLLGWARDHYRRKQGHRP